MPKRGPVPKPASGRSHARTRQTRGKPPAGTLTVIPGGAAALSVTPPVPAGLLAVTGERWRSYWLSPVATAVIDVDRPAIDRLFRYYDGWERMMSEATLTPFVEGSSGQTVSHPAAARVDRLEQHIGKLEAELGLTPLARSRLGIAFGQAQLTVAEVNRRTERTVEKPLDAELLAEYEDAR